jgi:hypothetical protein
LAGYYRYGPRKLEDLTRANVGSARDEIQIEVPKIHESVFERIRAGTESYAPIGLPNRYAVVRSDGAILDSPPVPIPFASTVPNQYETPDQAQTRAAYQEKVWDWVWGRRIAYFGTIIASLYLAALPLLKARPIDAACTSLFCPLVQVIDAVAAFVPNFASPWLSAFKTAPDWFAAGAISLGVCLLVGAWLDSQVRDQMRKNWIPLAKNYSQVLPPPSPPSWLCRFRTHPRYQALLRAIRRAWLPNLSAILLLAAGVLVLDRALFAIESAAGFVCPGSSGALRQIPVGISLGKPISIELGEFDVAALCWASRAELKSGNTYKITLTANAPWMAYSRDNLLDPLIVLSGLQGFELGAVRWHERLVPFLGIVLRRSVGNRWMRPMARIGSFGNDEYVLEPAENPTREQLRTRMTAIIKARSTGELFLYVNNFALATSSLGDLNTAVFAGTADVTIELVSQNETSN